MSSINVYLKGDVKDIDGYRDKVYRDGSGHAIKDVTISSDRAGRWYFCPNSLDAPIPEHLAEHVDEITCHEYLSTEIPHRESGIYKYKSATAELEYIDTSGRRDMRPKVEIRAEKMEDIAELLKLIKTGQIRPEESYEVAQDGLSGQALRDRVVELERQLEEARRREEQIGENTIHFGHIRTRVIRLRNGLLEGKSPLIKRGPIVDELNDMVNETSPTPMD